MRLRTSLFTMAILLCPLTLRADIFRWDDGAWILGTKGIELGPGVNLSGWNTHDRNLSFADFREEDLQQSDFRRSWLGSASFSDADLRDADFSDARLHNADFSDADLRDADFSNAGLIGAELSGANLTGAVLSHASFAYFGEGGLTKEQLYSTASYQQQDLRGIRFGNDLTGWDLSGQDLTRASFSFCDWDCYYGNLTDAILTGALVAEAEFNGSLTKEQLYSTASYQQKDLHGIVLAEMDLTGWDFSGQNLANANLIGTLTSATLTGAEIRGAWFISISKEQLYSTASYQRRDLQEVRLEADMSGWDLGGQNLANADLSVAGAILTGAEIRGARFTGLSKEQLYSTASYQRRDLREVRLEADMSGWDLGGQNLANADLSVAGAILTGAEIRGARFTGLSKEQLYSTASYQRRDLRGIGIAYPDLTDWDFSGQNLVNAGLTGWRFTDANFLGADLRNAHLGAGFDGTLPQAEFDSDTIYNQWTSFRNGKTPFDPVSAGLTFVPSPVGDFDANDVLDAADLHLLTYSIRRNEDMGFWLEDMFDVTDNGVVDDQDFYHWVRAIKRTWFGDANLDGEFNSSDLVAVFQAGEYEDDIEDNSGWAKGDWNADGDFTSSDIVVAFTDGGYEQGSRMAANAVPEPTSYGMLIIGLIGIATVSRTRWSGV